MEQQEKKDVSEMEKSLIRADDDEDFEETKKAAAEKPQMKPIPEAVDDFVRNFLRRAGLSRTLASFETEWYGSVQKLRTTAAAETTGFVPDALTHRKLLQRETDSVRGETELLRQEVQATAESLVRMQRERHFHQLQSRLVAEQKNALLQDFKQLKGHFQSYEPALGQLNKKYQVAQRQKMLISLQKDRIQNNMHPSLNQEKNKVKKESSLKSSKSADKSAEKSRRLKDSEFPVCRSPARDHLVSEGGKTPGSFRLSCSFRGESPGSFRLSCSFRAHDLPISCLALHPLKPRLSSASDDHSWRLWDLSGHGETVSDLSE